MLEQSVGPPTDEQLRRDAFNAANSAYSDISCRDVECTIEAVVARLLVCACERDAFIGQAISALLGNFEIALSQAESLTLDEIRKIEYELSDRALDRQARA